MIALTYASLAMKEECKKKSTGKNCRESEIAFEILFSAVKWPRNSIYKEDMVSTSIDFSRNSCSLQP